MNEEYLKKVFGTLNLDESHYEAFKNDMSTNEEYSKKVFGTLNLDESYYEAFKNDTGFINPEEPKKENTEVVNNIDLDSNSASVNSKSLLESKFPTSDNVDLKKKLEDKLMSSKDGIKSPKLNKFRSIDELEEFRKNRKDNLEKDRVVLDDLPDKGFEYKEKASKKLTDEYMDAYKHSNVDWKITDDQITREAINLRNQDLDDELYENTDMVEQAKLKLKSGSLRALSGITGIPNFINKTMFTVMASDEELEAINKLTPKQREAVLGGLSAGSPMSSLPLLSSQSQEYLKSKADEVEKKIVQFNNSVGEDFINLNFGKAFSRIGTDGAQMTPMLVQTMIPYVGLASVVAGEISNKQESLEDEGYELGLDTTTNSIMNGVVIGFSEAFTKKLGGKIFKTFQGLDDTARESMLQSMKKMVVNANKEGLTEFGEETMIKISDALIQGKEGQFDNYWKEMADVYILGGAMGGTLSATPSIIRQTKNLVDEHKTNKIISSKDNNYKDLSDVFKGTNSVDRINISSLHSTNVRLDKVLEKKVSRGDITQQESDKIKSNFLNTKEALTKLNKVKLSNEGKVKAVDLLIKKKRLTEEMKNTDEAFHPAYKEKIESINEEIRKTASIKDVESTKNTVKTETKTNEGEVKTKVDEEVDYFNNLKNTKNNDPEQYWSVDEVEPDAEGNVVSVEGGSGFVGKDGDIKGVFKHADSKKNNVADDILQKAVEMGGNKLDNFDNYLTKIYKRNGFRIVSRTPFNEQYAPKGWNKEKHGTPDVIAMIYDPKGELEIDEKKFNDSETGYDEMIAYRDSYINKLNENKVNESNTKEAKGDTTANKAGADKSTDGNVQPSNDKFKEAADEIRKLKVNKSAVDAWSKLQSNPVGGVIQAVWDGAIETVAKSIELTGDVTKGIQEGVKYIKNTDWYKSLSEQGKRDAVRQFQKEAFKDSQNKSLKEKLTDFRDTVKTKLGQTFSDKLFNFKIKTKNLKGFSDFLNQDSVWQSKAAGRSNLIKNKITDIIKRADKQGISIKQLSNYLMALHAEDRNKYIEENVNSDNPFGSGMSDVEIERALNVDSKTKEKLDKLAEEVYEIIENNRKRMLESGLIDQNTYDKLSEVKSYVPLTNFEEEFLEVSLVRQGKSISIKGSEFKSAGGRTTKAGNILVNVLQQSASTEIRAAKNEFLNTIHNLVDLNPDAELGKIYTDKNKPKAGVISKPTFVSLKVDGKQLHIVFNNDVLGKNILDTTNHQIGDLLKNLSKLNNYFRAVITTYNPEFMLGNFPRDLQTAIIHLQAQQDINEGLDGVKITKTTVKNIPKAMKAIAQVELGKVGADNKWKKHYDNFVKDGGKTGWTEQQSYESLLSELETLNKKGTKSLTKTKIKKFGQFIEGVNSAVENGVRFSSYVAAVEAGVSRETAASLAKELTVNFNRKGEAGTLLNAAYLFSNTAIQGTMTMYRNLSKVKKYKDVNGKTRIGLTGAQKIAAALVAIGGLIPLMNRAIADDDELSGENYYNTIPDFVKERNIIIMTGGKSYITVPLPYGYNTFYNFGESVSDVMTGNKSTKDASQYMLGSVLGSFSPVPLSKRDTPIETLAASMIPTEPLKFTVDILSNKNYNNMNIYNVSPPYAKMPTPDSHLGRKNTPDWAKWTTGIFNDWTGGSKFESGLIDINPETLIYTIHKAGGGVSKLGERTFSLGQKLIFNNLSEKPTTDSDKFRETYDEITDDKEIEKHTIPFVRRYFGEAQDRYFSNIYYEIKEDVYTDYAIYNDKFKDRETSSFNRKEKVQIAKVQRIKTIIDESDKLFKQIRNIEKRLPDKYPNRKDLQTAINALEIEKMNLYKRVYKEYKLIYNN
jgi:hypothetical protein